MTDDPYRGPATTNDTPIKVICNGCDERAAEIVQLREALEEEIGLSMDGHTIARCREALGEQP